MNPTSKKERIVEKWSDIISGLNIDVTKPISYFTANQIKEITQKEPRIMAKMDRIESLPKIFRENNLFLLPISRSEYAIVKGNGHHKPEQFEAKPEIFRTSKAFPSSAVGIEGESVFLDYANSCGLLERLCNVSNLTPSVRGRTTTPEFDFFVSDYKVKVNRAQIEVDASYESANELLIFEAKIGQPSSFSIKQLYYPYRTFMKKKKVRNFFFCFIPDVRAYIFWEYGFDRYDDFNSIRLLRYKTYQIHVSKVVPVRVYQNISPTPKLIDIPQADDVNKIMLFPFMVSEGYDTAKKMVEAFAFDIRQSSYYRQAAELLGLVVREKGIYKITSKGESLLVLSSKDKSNFMCRLLLEFPILNEIYLGVTAENKKFLREDIMKLLRLKSHIRGDTLRRRTQTVVAWFRWIKNNVGLINVEKGGTIAPQQQAQIF
ncbi:MAG: type II restriction enzyme [Nitrososphaerales archaeon]